MRLVEFLALQLASTFVKFARAASEGQEEADRSNEGKCLFICFLLSVDITFHPYSSQSHHLRIPTEKMREIERVEARLCFLHDLIESHDLEDMQIHNSSNHICIALLCAMLGAGQRGNENREDES